MPFVALIGLSRPLELSGTVPGGPGVFGPFRPHTLILIPTDTRDASKDDLTVIRCFPNRYMLSKP